MPIKISVITPTVNLNYDVLDCAKSVRYSEFEDSDISVEHIFVIDGGSLDANAWQAIQNLNSKTYKLKKIELPQNKGVANARNEALALAKGDFIMFLDSDDLYEPFKILEQVRLMRRDGANFSYTGFIEFSLTTGAEWKVNAAERLDKTILKDRCPICTSSVCISSTWLKSVMEKDETVFPVQKMRSDWLGWFKLSGKKNFRSTALNAHHVRRQISSSSLTANKVKTVLYNYYVYRKTGHSVANSVAKALIYPIDSLLRRMS